MYRVIISYFIMFGWTHVVYSYRPVIFAFAKYRWESLDYYYPNETARQHAMHQGVFIPGAAIPIDFHMHYHERVGARRFITTPRFVRGVPATIGYLLNDNTTNIIDPLIRPYPNWEMNSINGDCQHIISVHRIQIDECNRLWIIDTGISLNEPLCPPKILVYNLLTDEIISTYQFDDKTIMRDSKLMTLVVDIRKNRCDEAFVYIADPERYQLIVYNYKNNKSWSTRLFFA